MLNLFYCDIKKDTRGLIYTDAGLCH